MTIVSPSILSADFTKLGADCRMVLDAGAQMLHAAAFSFKEDVSAYLDFLNKGLDNYRNK